MLELRLRELWLWLKRVHKADLIYESCGHNHGEEGGEDGGVGLQVDADWADVEAEGGDLAVEEPPFDGDSDDSETGVEEDDSEDGVAAVLDSELRTEERLHDGEQPVQLEEHQGQQKVGSQKQTDGLVQAEPGVQVNNGIQDHDNQTPQLDDYHNKEIVCLENMGGP